MRPQSFTPRSKDEQYNFITNFSSKLATYKAKYHLTSEEMEDISRGAAYFKYWYDYRIKSIEVQKKVTQFLNELLTGTESLIEPQAPNLDADGAAINPPTAVPQGYMSRMLAIAKRIKAHNDYSAADGKDLGIETLPVVKEPVNAKPVIKATLTGGHPVVGWVKNGWGGIHIWVDRNDGQGYTFLATDTTPNYTDKANLPANTQSAIWKYKAMYIWHDEEIGQMSDEVSVTMNSKV